MTPGTIWTIGHSTHTQEDFLAMLLSFGITCVADIRHFPGSSRFPHFNREAMEHWLPTHDIQYVHFKELGGRRKPRVNSPNTAWRNSAFRGYADYMETTAFQEAIDALETLAKHEKVAYMCSEAVWWRCHRSLVSDYLKSLGWEVIHILGTAKGSEHPYTGAARIVDGKLSYSDDAILF